MHLLAVTLHRLPGMALLLDTAPVASTVAMVAAMLRLQHLDLTSPCWKMMTVNCRSNAVLMPLL